MAENVKYKFIQNVGDYFPSGYFSEDFIDKVQKASGLNSDQMTELCKPYVKLRGEYEKYKNYLRLPAVHHHQRGRPFRGSRAPHPYPQRQDHDARDGDAASHQDR